MTKLIVDFRNFINAPKNEIFRCLCFRSPNLIGSLSLLYKVHDVRSSLGSKI
jgi:hypothetical protein